jgi:NAD-dependent deacetylase
MARPELDQNKIVILSGAGLSAESGLPTFRDSAGLWQQHSWQELASPEGWAANPQLVLDFYNERRRVAWDAQPNAAHRAIAELEQSYEVVVVTQNVDALHERAGSTHIIHVHGELAWARGCADRTRRYRLDGAPIALGQLAEDGTQMRPDIVWFGEETQYMDEARAHLATAGKVLVVGTSLSVYPAASLADAAPYQAEKVLNAIEVDHLPHGYTFMRGRATEVVPALVRKWMS